MPQRNDLLASIAATTAENREGDIAAPTHAYAERRVNQFDAAVQLPILREMDHVLKNTYVSRKGRRSRRFAPSTCRSGSKPAPYRRLPRSCRATCRNPRFSTSR